jgi:hypothetical protein
MSKNYQKAAESMHLFLADTESESREELIRELRLVGVDVDRSTSDIKAIVGGMRPHQAADESPWRARRTRLDRYANKTRAELLLLLQAIKPESFSGVSDPVVCLESNGVQSLSDEQIRSLLEKLNPAEDKREVE